MVKQGEAALGYKGWKGGIIHKLSPRPTSTALQGLSNSSCEKTCRASQGTTLKGDISLMV